MCNLTFVCQRISLLKHATFVHVVFIDKLDLMAELAIIKKEEQQQQCFFIVLPSRRYWSAVAHLPAGRWLASGRFSPASRPG